MDLLQKVFPHGRTKFADETPTMYPNTQLEDQFVVAATSRAAVALACMRPDKSVDLLFSGGDDINLRESMTHPRRRLLRRDLPVN
jgi:hypothetical protein